MLAREGDQISIVGSSTVFPFATIAAERFAKNTDFKAIMDDLNTVLASNGSRMFQKKGKDFEGGFSIIDVAPNQTQLHKAQTTH